MAVAATGVDAAVLWRRVDRFALVAPGSPPGGSTYLLVGSDARDFATGEDDRERFGGTDDVPGARADVILVLRVDDDGAGRLLEIPRGLLVLGDRGAPVRLGMTLLGGAQPLVDAVCGSLGVGVDHVAILDMAGLRDLVDAVGGLEVRSPLPARDLNSGLELAAGVNHLDGDDALAYVGSRRLEVRAESGWELDPVTGTDRSGRAVEALASIGPAMGPSLLHPVATQRRWWRATGSVRVDEGFGLGDVRRATAILRTIPTVRRHRLPVDSSGDLLEVDRLRPGASDALAPFQRPAGVTGACRRPALPEARG